MHSPFKLTASTKPVIVLLSYTENKQYFRTQYSLTSFNTNLDEKVEDEVRKCVQTLDPLLEKDRKEDEKWRATIVLIWVSTVV